MDPIRNPYMPGAGRKPSALVGRDSTLASWKIALARAERGVTDQPFVLYGLRGVGKTVLLTQLRHDAEEQDWLVAQIEARPRSRGACSSTNGPRGPIDARYACCRPWSRTCAPAAGQSGQRPHRHSL